jgi:hypothetical protein
VRGPGRRHLRDETPSLLKMFERDLAEQADITIVE